MRYWPWRAAAVLAIAGFALLAGISSATAATLPTGFEERTVVSGLTAPTCRRLGTRRAHVRGREGRQGAGRDRRRRAGLEAADRHLRHVHTQRRPRPARASRWTRSFASNRYLYLLYTYDASASPRIGPKSSRLTRVTVNADNTASGETILLGSHPTQPCPAPSNNVDCIAVRQRLATRSGPCARLPTARCGSVQATAPNYGGVDRTRLRTHNEQSLNGKMIHIDRNGNGLPGHPFCPAVTDLDPGLHQGVGEGLPQPVPVHDPAERPSGGGRRGLGVVGGAEPRAAGTQLRLAVLRGQLDAPAVLELRRPARTSIRKEGTPAGIAFPDHLYGHGSGASIIGGPTYTGRPLPRRVRRRHHLRRLRAGVHQAPRAGRPGQAHRHEGLRDRLVRSRHRALERRALLRELRRRQQGVRARSCASPTRPNNSTPIAIATATPTFGPAPLKVTFKGGGSSDPDGDPLKYEWDFGDGTAKSTAKDPPVHTYNKGGNFDARLKVTDSKNASATATVRISVNNAPPVVTLKAPLDGAKYRDGVPVQLVGLGDRPRRRHRSPTRGWRGTSCSCMAATCIRSRA